MVPDDVLTPLGGCNEDDLVQVFDQYVNSWGGRCAGCHAVDACSPGSIRSPTRTPNNDPTCANGAPAPAGGATVFQMAEGDPNGARSYMYNLAGIDGFDTENPERSRFITKPLDEAFGGVCHGGGKKIADTNEQTYLDFLYFAEYYARCYNGGDPTTIPLPQNTMPRAQILFPPNNHTKHEADGVFLLGRADDPQDGALTGMDLQWDSNRVDGPLGFGDREFQVFLPVGEHLVTLTATDSNGNVATAEVTVFIVP